MSTARAKDAAMVAFGLLVIIVDQLTKHWVQTYFAAHPGTAISLLGDVLTLDYTQNTGVAFSLLSGQAIMFFLIALAICVIGALYWRTRETGTLLLKVSFGLVLGGAIGNLIDRIAHQYVVDFIHFQIRSVFDFAVFNVADSAITVGVILLAALLWLGGAETRGDTPSAPTTNDTSNEARTVPAKNAGER
ncbi:MAG TPA: signal peptidase II [Ktedonobacterales bacterium]|nr:signal peptidase II [Ktedonobacterales bacterium]